MALTTIDRATLRLVTQRMLDALKPLEAELGITFEARGGEFSSGASGVAKIGMTCNGPAGTAQTVGEADFKRMAPLFGLEPDDFGKAFTSLGKTYWICGAQPNSAKYPVLGKTRTGTIYKFPVSTVLAGLNRTDTVRPNAKPVVETAPAPEEEAPSFVAPPRPNPTQAMQDRLFG